MIDIYIQIEYPQLAHISLHWLFAILVTTLDGFPCPEGFLWRNSYCFYKIQVVEFILSQTFIQVGKIQDFTNILCIH